MGRKKDKKIEEFIKRLKKKFRIYKVILFGSRAYGEPLKNSDYDLIIVSDDFKNIRFIDRTKIVSKLWKHWETPLEALCYTIEEFEEKKKGINIVSEAVKKGIEIV